MTIRFLAWVLTAMPANADAPDLNLPEDPKAVVIEFAYEGGFTPPRMNDRPQMTVTAGGTVRVNDPFTGDTAEMTIEPRRVRELLRFVVVENDFFDFDEAEVKKAVEAERKRKGEPEIALADAPTTVVKVSTADGSHRAGYYALDNAAFQSPGVKPLRQLLSVSKRLDRLHDLTWAGGEAAIEADLKAVNARLAAEYPGVAALTPADLQYARREAGVLQVQFRRAGEREGTYVMAQLTRADGGREITIRARLE